MLQIDHARWTEKPTLDLTAQVTSDSNGQLQWSRGDESLIRAYFRAQEQQQQKQLKKVRIYNSLEGFCPNSEDKNGVAADKRME